MTQIKDFEGYYITRCGEVYSTRKTSTPKKLSTKPDKNTGYIFVMFNMNGKTYRKTVHRLVATCFIPNPENKEQVNHIDGNKSNNDISNLEWNTRSENMQHAFKTGLNNGIESEKASSAKLNNEQCRELIKLLFDGLSNEQIGKKFNLHSRYVSLIRGKKRWKEIWKEFEGIPPESSDEKQFKLTKEARLSILEEIVNKTRSLRSIALEYKIDPSVLSNVSRRKKWINLWNIYDAQRLSKA